MHRKTLPATVIALALATPLAAQAQSPAPSNSNVTIYGLIDINLAVERAGSQRRTGVDHSELNGTRFGFRGSEDLGNGLKAIFTMEGGFDPSAGGSEQGGRLFGRQSFVGLEGGWGRVTLGRQYSPAFVAIDPFDATGSADRSPGLLSRKAGSVRPAYEVRFDNMVKYRSPEFAGFSADVGYWLGEKNGSSSDARREGNGWGIAGLYKNGPIAGSLVTQSMQRDATGGKVRTDGLGFSYDFGPVKAYLAYTRDKESGSQGDGKARTYDIGAEIKAGPQGTVAISYANRNESEDAAGEDAHGWSVYYLHDLSKRTTLYTGYSQLTNKDNANYAIGNLTPAAGDDPRVVMAGIRHKF
ncbi:porin [Aromatoleum diolicum]|uniref:Porin n=1 Tax=Aromatoleum diolicum TaxID=75796 RepID=A0ABX1QD53_9RHOO|nr:porin [Aromatoleum diolicum]NMG75440.1 porin [Aromatoleum diolicum]